MKNLREIFYIWDNANRLTFNQEEAYQCVLDGNYEGAYSSISSLIKEEVGKMRKELCNQERTLYRFSGFARQRKDKPISENEIINDIREGRITLSNPMNFNDPMDPLIRVWAEELVKANSSLQIGAIAKLIEMAMKPFRIGCMMDSEDRMFKENHPKENEIKKTKPYLNTFMWGHYTNNHTGVCLKYKITPEMLTRYNDEKRTLILGDVRYRWQKAMSDYITLDNALLAKSNSWKKENETRLIFYSEYAKDLKYSNGRKRNYVPLGGFEIEEIYLGYKIKDEYKQAIKDAVAGKNITLYQMKFDMYDITKLKAERI